MIFFWELPVHLILFYAWSLIFGQGTCEKAISLALSPLDKRKCKNFLSKLFVWEIQRITWVRFLCLSVALTGVSSWARLLTGGRKCLTAEKCKSLILFLKKKRKHIYGSHLTVLNGKTKQSIFLYSQDTMTTCWKPFSYNH